MGVSRQYKMLFSDTAKQRKKALVQQMQKAAAIEICTRKPIRFE